MSIRLSSTSCFNSTDQQEEAEHCYSAGTRKSLIFTGESFTVECNGTTVTQLVRKAKHIWTIKQTERKLNFNSLSSHRDPFNTVSIGVNCFYWLPRGFTSVKIKAIETWLNCSDWESWTLGKMFVCKKLISLFLRSNC